MQGDFKDVSYDELRALGREALRTQDLQQLLAVPPRGYQGFTIRGLAQMDEALRAGVAVWGAMMREGQWLGELLRGREVAAVVGAGACRTLFVHAALTPAMLQVRCHRACLMCVSSLLPSRCAHAAVCAACLAACCCSCVTGPPTDDAHVD